jgi:hypothetical protein
VVVIRVVLVIPVVVEAGIGEVVVDADTAG